MEEKKYSAVETDEIIVQTTQEYPLREKSIEVPITLWCFRVLFSVAVITVWCLSLNFSTLLFKDFLYSCKTYDCDYAPELNLQYVNDTFCAFNFSNSSIYYLPTRCNREINDIGLIMTSMTWTIPYFGILLGGDNKFEIYWRRFCFLIEIFINCLILWNKMYVFLFLDAFLLYCWFLATPFMCGKPSLLSRMRK